MNPSNKIRKLVAEGYQLTLEAFSFLGSQDDLDDVIDKILSSGTDKLILSKEDILEIINVNNYVEDLRDSDDLIEHMTIIEEEDILEPEEQVSSKETEESKEDIEDIQIPTKKKKSQVSVRKEISPAELEILYSPKITKTAATAEIFRKYFENRYEVIRSYFSKRRDITNRVTTSDLSSNKDQDKVSLIAIVKEIKRFNNGTVNIEVEDLAGAVTCTIYSSNPDLVQTSQFILEDSVLCFIGKWRNGRLNVYNVLWPDIPFTHKSNYSNEELLSLHISDIHVGSKNFAGKLFHRVINLINGDLEKEKYNEIGRKIKYLFIAGDVVDGVGVYPGQREDLAIDGIEMQYHLVTEYLDQIRKDVEIIIIPGNHDGARDAEPQTPIQKEFAPDLVELDNVHLLGSPCYVKAHNVEFLLNHGNSILDINAAIPAIPHETSIPAMREMLKNRHLVPIYGKRTSIAPIPTDELIISRIPDVFHTGHTHIAGDEKYKGVLLLNSGTFQYQTSYQRSMNIQPTTGLTYIVNLQKLERSEINFQEIN